MKFTDRIRLAKNAFVAGTPNFSDPNFFLKHGNQNKPMLQDWSQTLMSDEDFYTGFGYGAVNRRANRLAWIVNNVVKTKANQAIVRAAERAGEEVVHPYLRIIDESPTFTNYQFWQWTTKYIDLKGAMYILVIRNFDETRVGEVQEFKLLNPYNVKRVVNQATKEIGGYIEMKGTQIREIPLQMMIEIAELNPFDWTKLWSMKDAIKDTQFTMRTADDYTRKAIAGNINAPGILEIGDEDLALDEEKFKNFKARVTGRGADKQGEPLFGVGKGALTWQDMQIDLNKASLKNVHSSSIDEFSAVTGNSKTQFNIEQSGVTRESGRMQSDLFLLDHLVPQMQLIADALNQDYKNSYPVEYKRTGYTLWIDNPLESDHDAEIKDTEAKTKRFDLTMAMVDRGYDVETSARYAKGDIDIEAIGEPSAPQTESSAGTNQLPEVVKNQLNPEAQRQNLQAEGALMQAVQNVEEQLLVDVSAKIGRAQNQYESESDIINQRDKKAAENQLETALTAFYGTVMTIYGATWMSSRLSEYVGTAGLFKFTNDIKRYIRGVSGKVSGKHVDTVLEDMRKVAQTQALAGASVDQIQGGLRVQFSGFISKTRAETVARTETARAFNHAQFFADGQWIKQNKFTNVYKKWVTQSDDKVCPYCQEMERRGPIPFEKNFLELGDSLTASFQLSDGSTSVRSLPINFEPVDAGNAHVNDRCDYELVNEDGSHFQFN